MRKTAVVLLLALAAAEDADPAALLKSKEVSERLDAVRALAGREGSEALLLEAIKDRDWEVVHRAVEALATRGGAASTEALLEIATDGPTRAIRLEAARSLARIDSKTAADRLCRSVLQRRPTVAALEALTLLDGTEAAPRLEKLLATGKEPELRRAALAALASLHDPARLKDFVKLLKDEDVSVRAGAVAAMVETGDPAALDPLLLGLRLGTLTGVLERRYRAGIRELLLRQKDPSAPAKAVLGAFAERPSAPLARLLGLLGRRSGPVGPREEYAAALAGGLGKSTDASVRAACAAALARAGDSSHYDALATAVEKDGVERVKFHALRAAAALKGKDSAPLLLSALGSDLPPLVREEAAALMGRFGTKESLPALVRALDDPQWFIAVAAAVSIGKLRLAEGVDPLVRLLGHKDWRLRGAAAAGLGRIRQIAAIDPLIDACGDKDPSVRRTAVESMRVIAGRDVGDKEREWEKWWAAHRANFEFTDWEEVARREKKYGYAVQDREAYQDLDVIVLVTRGGGDNIQDLLTQLKIGHRLTRAASVDEAGLHPRAIFVANCPGEIVEKDVERIDWFVRSGGALFASCWALTHTINLAWPGIVRKAETRSQVIDTVPAEPLPNDAPFLQSVFESGTRAQYELMGSHLLEIVDPERCEALVDSPDCAARWGEGTLAGWFTVGHGVVFDSANHFDLQGMKQARLDTEEERMAFAMDRLGYSYAQLREARDGGVFRTQPRAAKEGRDLTIFRLISAFVRQKRLDDLK